MAEEKAVLPLLLESCSLRCYSLAGKMLFVAWRGGRYFCAAITKVGQNL